MSKIIYIYALLAILLWSLPLTTAVAAQESLVLKPGISERGQKPETWQIDLTGLTREQAQANAARLSTRLYGTAESGLHAPLIIKANYNAGKVFAIGVVAVSWGGATLEVKLNGTAVARRSWPAAGATHNVKKVLYLDVPAGPVEIALEVTDQSGVVVMNALYIADSVAQLPGETEKFEGAPPTAPAAGAQPVAGAQPAPGFRTQPADGYRGIWFTLGQFSQHGDKYSGGLGTYTANHNPMAVYAPQVDKTFFTYGGTIKGQRHLLLMVAYYDHKTGQVPRPMIVHDKQGVDDPHDNGSINIDDKGHIWIFVSGRGKVRPGFKYRSKEPFSITDFELVSTEEMTYPQPWHVPGQGFFHLFTKYTKGRELYWETSADGQTWSGDHKLAGLGGHYQVSGLHNGKIATFFNYHPGGDVDKRTNLYYAQTTNFGQTWTTADGKTLSVPLSEVKNAALVLDYQAQGTLMYTCDLNFDRAGNPLLLYVTSRGPQPGPQNDPRALTLARWDGKAWQTSVVGAVDHNYDMGSLYVDGVTWTIIAPTLPGPQPGQGGGEMCRWTSEDEGETWTMQRQITNNSKLNHNYARRPHPNKDPFFAFWADGDPTKLTESRLFFTDSRGEHVWQLPYDMDGELATPLEIKP